jgi:hypothetical protein
MKLPVLLLAAVSAWAAWAADVPPRVTFSKSFAGSAPPFFAITVERTGATTYNESNDPDNAEPIQLEPRATGEIFALADKLEHFRKPLESGLKVANMGMKTLRWEEAGQTSESKFNYTAVEDAKLLSDWFERIGDSARLLLELRRAAKHDRLGVNEAIVNIQTLWNNRRLLGTGQFLPLLDEVAGNEAYIHMARERAAQIADAIRASSAK